MTPLGQGQQTTEFVCGSTPEKHKSYFIASRHIPVLLNRYCKKKKVKHAAGTSAHAATGVFCESGSTQRQASASPYSPQRYVQRAAKSHLSKKLAYDSFSRGQRSRGPTHWPLLKPAKCSFTKPNKQTKASMPLPHSEKVLRGSRLL